MTKTVTVTIEMTRDKKCKHCDRYKADDPNAVVGSVYVDHSAFETMPEKVFVTVSDVKPYVPPS